MATAVKSLVDVALEYANRGWRIFPLHSIHEGVCTCGKSECPDIGKHPHWTQGTLEHGCKDATTDAEQLREWWVRWPDANVGIATGRGSNLLIVDVDPRHGGTVESLGELPVTTRVQTGSGGWHLYFQYPEGVKVTTSSGNLPRGIDVRAEGGYVVAPGSIHHSGRRYDWDVEAEIAEIPQHLLEQMTAKRRVEKSSKADTTVVVRGSSWLERAVSKVVDGGEGRNETGLWLACQLRDNGIGETEAAGILADYVERVGDLGDHEYTIAEARASLAQAYSREPRQPASRQVSVVELPPEVEFTDTGNAQRLARMFGHRLKYIPQWGWLAYRGGKWTKRADGIAMQCAKACVQDMLREASECQDGKRMIALMDHAKRSFAEPRLRSMLSLAQSEPGIAAQVEDFDSDPMLLNVLNGTVDLRTGELRPHSPKDMLSKQAHVEYDAAATAPRFEQFLREIFAGDADLVGFVQRALGYSITGDVREHAYFTCFGSGANGKSTLMNLILGAMGDYASPLKADVLLKQPYRNSGSADPELASLVGARFVVAQEPQSGELDTAKVKEWTGGDAIMTREPYKMPFTFRPQFKLWLSTNERPDVTETTSGIWRRIHLVPFMVSFAKRKDEALLIKLQSELSGVLNWLIAGCLSWQRHGLGSAEAVKAATREYRESEDPYLEFFETVLVPDDDPESKVLLGDAYERFKTWQRGAALPHLIDRQFTKQAEAHGYPVKRSNGKRWLRGCRIEVSAASVAQGHFHQTFPYEANIEKVTAKPPLSGTTDTAATPPDGTLDEMFSAEW